jgi:hypothetical protein
VTLASSLRSSSFLMRALSKPLYQALARQRRWLRASERANDMPAHLLP